ncbi:sensor domain-containing protein [Clostridium sp.]|uniref:sensor domain-containing protein n=1 Tax=Clostridium sp. TaxID=1506 RepID=UPI003F2EA2EB
MNLDEIEKIIDENNALKEELKYTKLKYNTLLNAIPSMAWFTDVDSHYYDVNKEFLIHCGKDISEIKGKNHKNVWTNKVGDECRQNDLEVLRKCESGVFEEIVPGERGYRRFDIYRSPVIDENNKAIGIVAVARDTTEIKNMDAQFRVLIENIPFEVWLCNKDGDYVNANIKFAKTHNTTVEQLIGRNLREFYSKEEVDIIIGEDKEVMSTKQSNKFTKEVMIGDKKKSVEIYKTPVLNIANEVVGIVGTTVDITQLKEAENKIKKQAYTDSNTGLLNRRALYEYLGNKEIGKKLTMLIIDVDNFKQINDTYGHQVGDGVLKEIANTLREICIEDYIFRFGGDEFIILFKNEMPKKEIELKVNSILSEISEIESYGRYSDNVNVSIGVAVCPKNHEECDGSHCKLITMADIALYKAKETGKNKFVFYTNGLEEERNVRLNIEKALSHAIENNEIKLAYQPQYSKDNKLRGFEALFRWNNKNYRDLPVMEIINIMEKSDLIIPIGNEIMKKACIFAKKINENTNNKLIVSFNVSSTQIMDDNFIDYIKDIINETGVYTNCIGIEITETVLLENINENIQKINDLKKLGIKISLDDFGTGYSSFNYLVKLPLSEVKIDKSFVAGMENGEEYSNLIKLIIDSSHSLDLPIVAEGVETMEQLNKLSNMGVDYIQGYLFSKPLEEKDAFKLIMN